MCTGQILQTQENENRYVANETCHNATEKPQNVHQRATVDLNCSVSHSAVRSVFPMSSPYQHKRSAAIL